MCNEEITIRIEEVEPVGIDVKLDIAYAEDPTLVTRLDELNGEVVGVTSSAKIAAAIDSKEAIADAVNGKGGNITANTPLSAYAEEIQTIPVSVVGKPSDGPRVRFFDYDGTLLKTEYVPKGGSATAPEIPQHERLVFEKWRNSFENVVENVDIGVYYTTKSGKCEFDAYVNAQGKNTLANGTKPDRTINIGLMVTSGTVTVEWGDGSVDKVTATSRITHTYSETGKYIILISGTGKWTLNQHAFSYSGIASTGSQDTYITEARLTGIPSALSAYVFKMAYALHTLSLSSDITLTINTFNGCQAKHSVSSTGTNYLYTSSSVESVVLSSAITQIGLYTFHTSRLSSIVLPPALTYIDTGAFQATRIEEITIPVKVTSIGQNAFWSCQYLSKMIMKPETPPTLGTEALFNHGYLKEIIVPKGCAEAYKSATNWSEFADIIKEEEE